MAEENPQEEAATAPPDTAEPAQEDVAAAPAAGAGGGDDSTDEVPELFPDSVYKYLIHFGKSGDDNADTMGFVVAVITVVVQWILYGILLGEGQQKLKDDHIGVAVEYGRKCTTVTNLLCKAEDGNFAYNFLAMVLLSMFLMSDAIEALRGFFYASNPISKVGAMAVMATTGYACFTGSVWAYQGIYNGSNYDAIVNCVGVLFIADVDEKIQAAYDIIMEDTVLFSKLCCCCKCFLSMRKPVCLIFCCLVFFGVCVAAMVNGEAQTADLDSSYYWYEELPYWDSNFDPAQFFNLYNNPATSWDTFNFDTFDFPGLDTSGGFGSPVSGGGGGSPASGGGGSPASSGGGSPASAPANAPYVVP